MRFSSAEDNAGSFTLLNIAFEDAMDNVESAKRLGRGYPLRLPLSKGSIYTKKTH